MNVVCLYTPNNFNLFIVKKKYNYYLYIKYNNIYFICNILYFYIFLNYIFYLKKRYFFNFLNTYFFSWIYYVVKKIKFKHKITWVYLYRKNLQILNVSTNFSHEMFFLLNEVNIKRKKKHLKMHTLVLWGLDIHKINIIVNKIIQCLPLNHYTLRGFKLARTNLIKRVGKVNKYSMVRSKII